jgi:hypothetical protein
VTHEGDEKVIAAAADMEAENPPVAGRPSVESN